MCTLAANCGGFIHSTGRRKRTLWDVVVLTYTFQEAALRAIAGEAEREGWEE